jgi:hypothetical protein
MLSEIAVAFAHTSAARRSSELERSPMWLPQLENHDAETHGPRAAKTTCAFHGSAGWLLAVLVTLCLAIGSAMVRAAEVDAPSMEKLQHLGAFFENEVATGKISGAIGLVQQDGHPVYLKTFGVRDVT